MNAFLLESAILRRILAKSASLGDMMTRQDYRSLRFT